MSPVVITLPDGTEKRYDKPVTPQIVAREIGRRLEEAAIAAKADGKEIDLTAEIAKSCRLEIITQTSKEGLEILRHSTAHLLAQAVKELYPGTQITIGPVIEDGFFYDIDCPVTLTIEDLPKIENKMSEIVSRKLSVERKEFPKEEAVELFKKLGENYKVELIHSFPPSEGVSAYQQGNFIDLCRGPHIPNTSKMGKFKLLSIAGAYWRGDEKNKMLQRIYGTTFATQKELDEHLKNLEEAKKRDHRKIGPELGLFVFLPVAPAMPFYLPKGTVLLNLLANFMRKETEKMGYQEVACPQLLNFDLWIRSGHAEHYKDDMFCFENNDGQSMALKPMNCPGHFTLYGTTKHSYRELPIRYSEFTRLHRNERTGVTHGLFRTRNFSQDDGHIFLTEDQIHGESLLLIRHIFSVYKSFGFNDVTVKLATRPEKFMGQVENWDKAIKALETSLNETQTPFTISHGEGAFYGPKIEFHVRDSLKRSWQCGTIQIDFSNPELFDLEYIDKDGQPKRPVVIHRAILGSFERFIGILIEHFAGHFPFWLSPTQVTVINVTDEQLPYCQSLAATLTDWGLRLHTDFRNEKLGYKIREAQLQRVPYMIVIGNKEKDSQTLSIRKNNGETLNNLSLDAFKNHIEPFLKPGGENH